MSETKLPAPRLQLRWEENDGTHGYSKREYKWLCHYELVLPLGEYDIRREVHDEDGNVVGKRNELVAPIKGPSARGSSSQFPPCTSGDGKRRYCDTPFRDGAHALWDAKLLGGLPIFVIAPDGASFQDQPKEPQ